MNSCTGKDGHLARVTPQRRFRLDAEQAVRVAELATKRRVSSQQVVREFVATGIRMRRSDASRLRAELALAVSRFAEIMIYFHQRLETTPERDMSRLFQSVCVEREVETQVERLCELAAKVHPRRSEK